MKEFDHQLDELAYEFLKSQGCKDQDFDSFAQGYFPDMVKAIRGYSGWLYLKGVRLTEKTLQEVGR